MIDPNNLFDISKLNDHEVGQLEFIVNSPAWSGFFRLYLIRMIQSLDRLMKDRSEERKKQYNDDFIAGQSTALEGFVKFSDGVAENTNLARMAQVQQMTPNEEYDRLRILGMTRHSGQTVQPDDLIPFEEF